MNTRKLKDLTVSEIGMGCMGFSHGYGEIPSEDYAVDAIRKAFDYHSTPEMLKKYAEMVPPVDEQK